MEVGLNDLFPVLVFLVFIFPFYAMFMMATYKTENLYSSIPVYPEQLRSAKF